MNIYGAGIAGLLAGSVFQTARIIEAGPENQSQHKAVLRFRSSIVGDTVGIDFRKVRVHKGIWIDGRFVEPNIMLSNLYSKKVIGRIADRSIWAVDAVDRFIAPDSFIEQLAERCGKRIEWNTRVTTEMIELERGGIISTIPMPIMVKLISNLDPTSPPTDVPEFNYAPITVKRWRLPKTDVFQTVYFPDPATSLYRASITGDMMIAEYAGVSDDYDFFEAFGLNSDSAQETEKVSQRYGKISPIDNEWRKRFIFKLSSDYEIFSLGRFGTWRNLLLDDVVKDISVIKKLSCVGNYERSRHAAK